METVTKKVIRKKIAKILPYIDGTSENMGLTKYNMVLFDGADQKEQLTCLERNGQKVYITGLNEFAPEVQNIQNKEDKEAVIKDIRTKVAYIEQTLNSKTVKIEDENFWEKIEIAHPKNSDLWDSVFVQPKNEPVFLNEENPMDLIVICAIEAGGFSMVAKSWEDARTSARPPKFFLDRATDTSVSKNEVKKIKNAALATLNELFNKDQKKLFYVIKNIDNNSFSYTKNTSPDVIYDYLDSYITGQGVERSAKKAAEYFSSVCEQSREDLLVKAVIADASFRKLIQHRADGMLYHGPS
jgi:hypothetical protein